MVSLNRVIYRLWLPYWSQLPLFRPIKVHYRYCFDLGDWSRDRQSLTGTPAVIGSVIRYLRQLLVCSRFKAAIYIITEIMNFSIFAHIVHILAKLSRSTEIILQPLVNEVRLTHIHTCALRTLPALACFLLPTCMLLIIFPFY